MIYDPYQRLNYLRRRTYYSDDFALQVVPRLCDVEGHNRRCQDCRRIRPVVYFDTDPFEEEIRNVYRMRWICNDCYSLACDEI